jgi:thioredoxin-like negative regulator of GroEL
VFPEAPWIVVVFTSATCGTCNDVATKAEVLSSPEVAVARIDYTTHPEMHARYKIEAVPALVVADAAGVVKAGFLGPVKAQDLWAAVAECREPGSSPGSCENHSN